MHWLKNSGITHRQEIIIYRTTDFSAQEKSYKFRFHLWLLNENAELNLSPFAKGMNHIAFCKKKYPNSSEINTTWEIQTSFIIIVREK